MDEEFMEVEVLDGEIVPADAEVPQRHVEPERALARPQAVHTAVVAATGFVAGAATLALLHRRHVRGELEQQQRPLSIRRGTYVIQIRPLQ